VQIPVSVSGTGSDSLWGVAGVPLSTRLIATIPTPSLRVSDPWPWDCGDAEWGVLIVMNIAPVSCSDGPTGTRQVLISLGPESSSLQIVGWAPLIEKLVCRVLMAADRNGRYSTWIHCGLEEGGHTAVTTA
jgi:hypothetical protein